MCIGVVDAKHDVTPCCAVVAAAAKDFKAPAYLQLDCQLVADSLESDAFQDMSPLLRLDRLPLQWITSDLAKLQIQAISYGGAGVHRQPQRFRRTVVHDDVTEAIAKVSTNLTHQQLFL